jgi:hypothetical protein
MLVRFRNMSPHDLLHPRRCRTVPPSPAADRTTRFLESGAPVSHLRRRRLGETLPDRRTTTRSRLTCQQDRKLTREGW